MYVVENNVALGRIILADEIKESAAVACQELNNLGIKTYMITGDKNAVAADIAKRCNISAFYAQQLPEDKLSTLQKIKSNDETVGFVGDGINDAPVLASSDVGFAMGQFGSASAVEAADIVVMNDDLKKIPMTVELARRTYALAKQNMALVIAVKAIILILGALGIANIWLAILGDVGLCIIAVLNAMRPLYWVKSKQYDIKEIAQAS